MGVLTSIIRSKDDLVKPSKKSYWGYEITPVLISKNKILKKKRLLFSDKKVISHELSGIEPVEKVILLKNKNKRLGRLTTQQLKEIFDDMGFNVDVLVSEKFNSDIDAVMNIGEWGIPGWVVLARKLSKLFPSREKMLLSKLSAKSDRLHVRMFEGNDQSWLVIAHTDHNWLSLNLKKIYTSHFKHGAGDYITGTTIVFELLREFSKITMKNKVFKQSDIEKILKKAYKNSIIKKLN